jgi:hypothetical protein
MSPKNLAALVDELLSAIKATNSDGCRVPGTSSKERTIDCRTLI